MTLSYVVALLRDQADHGQAVDASVFRLRPLPRSASLPRHLSERERQSLEQTMQQRLATADGAPTAGKRLLLRLGPRLGCAPASVSTCSSRTATCPDGAC